MDDRLVTEDTLQANFLIPRDSDVYGGRSLSEVCCESLRDFNPMVRVSAEKGQSYFFLKFYFLFHFFFINIFCDNL